MNEAFDKVIGFFLAVTLLFGIPFLYFGERQESLEQTFLLTETAEFVDTVRNMGELDREVYERYLKKVEATSGIYEIEMLHICHRLELAGGRIHIVEEETWTSQLQQKLEEEGVCSFSQGDFFKVKIQKKNPGIGMRFLGMFVKDLPETGQTLVYYGGCIRNDGG